MAFCAKCGNELPGGATFCPACGAPVQAQAAAPSPSAGSSAPLSGIDSLMKDSKAQEYWLWRLVAFIIDVVIIAVVLTFLALAVTVPFFLSGGAVAFTGFFFGGFAVLSGIILIFYFPLMESSSGASIGKHAMHLRVVSKSGSNPTFLEAFVRNISKIYWLLLLLDVIVGLAVTKGYQQKYSDSLMGTSVVRA